MIHYRTRNRWYLGSVSLLFGCLLSPLFLPAVLFAEPIKAFPDAQGWAAYTPGGRGGQIIRVTNLKARGPGSFAAAVRMKGPRIVVFEVGGVIDLQKSSLTITEPFLTITGQTAPSPGITFIRGGISIEAHDVIVRHICVRPGEAGAKKRSGWEVDGIATGSYNIIVDHCSCTWATDENLSASGPRFEGKTVDEWQRNTSHRITFSNCIIAEGLRHSTHGKGEHSKGSLIHDNITEIALIGNLYANNMRRNPYIKGGVRGILVNNYIVNPGRRAIHYCLSAGEWEGHKYVTGQIAIVGNVMEHGRNTPPDMPLFVLRGSGPVDVFARDNITLRRAGQDVRIIGTNNEKGRRADAPPLWPDAIDVMPVTKVKDYVLKNAGARPWDRDAIDKRIIREAREGAGKVIDSEQEVGGYPAMKETRSRFDSRRWNLATMEKKVLRLNPEEVRQEIDGFGASGSWWAQIVGGWEESKRKEIVGLLFGEEGIGLSIYRYNVGAGSGEEIGDPWRRAQTFETAKGKYDWDRDRNAMRILREACAAGVENVVLFANSPPLRMTKSGDAFAGSGEDKSNLREDMYEEFARYLADIAEHFIRVEKIPVEGVSPINEPQWDWDGHSQEGCHYSAEEVVRMVEIMLREIEKRGLPVEVEAPENGSWEMVAEPMGDDWKRSPVYLERLLGNEFVRERLDSYAIHSYWANLERKKAFAKYFFAKYPGKKLQMTEWCEMKGGRDYGMDSALRLTREIMDDLVWGGVSSWQYWIAVSRYNFRDGLIYVNESEREIVPIKRLWAMGNFSRFIRPGYRRFEVEHNSPVLRVAACKSQDGDRIVVVVMNPGAESEEVELQFAQGRGANIIDAYETSRENDLKAVSREVKNNGYRFPAESVTTLIIKE